MTHSKTWQLLLLTLILLALWKLTLSTSPVLASLSPPQTQLAAPQWQIFPTPTPLTSSTTVANSLPTTAQIYSGTFADFNFTQASLQSPFGEVQYIIRLPHHWQVVGDVQLDLVLDYQQQLIGSDDGTPLAAFGDISIVFNNELIDQQMMIGGDIRDYTLSIDIPAELWNQTEDQTPHFLQILFDTSLLCQFPHEAQVVIKDTSLLEIPYITRLLEPDLADYPQFFFQRSFLTEDKLYLALPEIATPADLQPSLAIASKLGDLSGNSLVLTATNASDLELSITGTPRLAEHLLVLGQPQNNRLIPRLAELADLPLSLHQRTVALQASGPSQVNPETTFTYHYTLTNTTPDTLDVSLVNPLPKYTRLVNCSPRCAQPLGQNSLRWSNISLSPGQVMTNSLELALTEVISGISLDNTLTVWNRTGDPIGGLTLSSHTVATPISPTLRPALTQVSQNPDTSPYFFALNNLAVPEQDGILQLIPSPWAEEKAILLITGLNETAVAKAAWALSAEPALPGLAGNFALVEDFYPVQPSTHTITSEIISLADLEYSDQIIRGAGSTATDYFFDVPLGWRLDEDSAFTLQFNHTQVINYESSSLHLSINRAPIASIFLSDETSFSGELNIPLQDVGVRHVESNRLTIEANLDVPEVCDSDNRDSAWLRVKDSSFFNFSHRLSAPPKLSLDFLPYPYQQDDSLREVAFVLPPSPTLTEIQQTLRLASYFGNAAGGRVLAPNVYAAGVVSQAELQNQHVVAVGRPSRNALLAQVNEALPQPFIEGTDEIRQMLDKVIFRLPVGTSLGYLQILPTPWNENRAFLAITGTTDEAVAEAVSLLTQAPWLLGGDLAMVRNDEVRWVDSITLTAGGRQSVVASAFPDISLITETLSTTDTATLTATTSLTATPTAPATPIDFNTDPELPIWIFIMAGVTAVIVILILGFAFWQAWRS